MADEEKILPEAEDAAPDNQAPGKTMWQLQKENWYEKIPLTLKQLDIIIVLGLVLLALTFVVIFLDAADIINPFGY